MRFAAIILLLALSDISFGQAVWNGRQYNAPVCNKQNCQMCNAIRAQLTTPKPTYTQNQQIGNLYLNGNAPLVEATTRVMTSQPQQYRTEYRTVSKQVKRCNGKQCWYETVTELVAVQVPIPFSFRNEGTSVSIRNDISLDKVDKLVPTPEDATLVAIDLLALDSGDVLFEPGCGDGRLLSKATCRAIGIELNPETASLARTNAPNAIVLTGDAALYDYSGATVVYMYLYPDLMNKIIPLLKPGTRIVSYCHSVPGIQWEQHIVKGHTFYTGTK